jgi:hypothetical protein
MFGVPEGYDYSHLVGNPAKENDKEFDAERFDELLTAYDRKLLRCDFRIAWQEQADCPR